MTARSLPTGRAGTILALGLALLVLLAAWFALVAPLLEEYAERGARLEQRRVLARRMAVVASTLPQLQRTEASSGTTSGVSPSMLLAGASDAVAAASLQERVQDMARRAGASVSSAETLPATQAGAYRRIGLHVSLTGPWTVLVRLLEQIEQSSPRMLVDDLELHGARMVAPPADPPLGGGFTVFAFRAPAGGVP